MINTNISEVEFLKCRACDCQTLEETVYCHNCGWLNGEIAIDTDTICFIEPSNASETSVIKSYIAVKHSGSAPVKACFTIIDNDEIRFEGDAIQFMCDRITDDIMIPIILKSKSAWAPLKLLIEANDGKPTNNRGSFKPDEKGINDTKRVSEVSITVLLIKPHELSFDRNLIVMNESNRSARITIANPNKCEAEITRISESDKIRFRANKPLPLTISAEASEFYLAAEFVAEEFPAANEKHLIEVEYTVGGTKYNEKLLFLLTAQKSSTKEEFYEYIISIDFGTSKTTGAYMIPYEVNAKIKDLAVVPSQISYDGYKVYAGSALLTSDWSISSIKTHLSEPKIVVGEVSRDTETVIKDFLREIRKQLLSGVLKDKYGTSRNKYIITVPVLDGVQGEQHERQKEMTRRCVEEVFLNTSDKESVDVEVILESEAALYAIVDSFIDKSKKVGSSIDITHGDICVFDYGAGTLDISIGTCSINENEKLVFESKVNIGKFRRDGEKRDISLGGNEINLNMYKEFVEYVLGEGGKPIKEDSEKRFDRLSAFYADRPYDDLQAPIEDVKIKISRAWSELSDSSGITVKPESADVLKYGCADFPKHLFRRVVDGDINAAIDAIKSAVIKDQSIHIEHLFIVGGTGLLERIKENMEEDEFFSGIDIHSPHDYGFGDDEDEDNGYERMSQLATRAVSRGAVRWYSLKFNNNVNFRIMLKDERGVFAADHAIKKGAPLPAASTKSVILTNVKPENHLYAITAFIDGYGDFVLGKATVDTTVYKGLHTLELRIVIDTERVLKLEYRVRVDGSEEFMCAAMSNAVIV